MPEVKPMTRMERKRKFETQQAEKGRKRWETYATPEEIAKMKIFLLALRERK